MLTIKTYTYENGTTLKAAESHLLENPGNCVYILENGKQAYIGQTVHVDIREYQHGKDKEKIKCNFKRIHIIDGENFDASPAVHFESLLISLFKVDCTFEVLNGNEGYREYLYDRELIFDLEFDKLWTKLREMGLVKTKTAGEVMNSVLYKYFPRAELTKKQRDALENIIKALDSGELTAPRSSPYKNRPVVVEGDAGTGKTVLAMALFQYLMIHEPYRSKKIRYVVAHTPIREVAKEVFRDTKGLLGKYAVSPAEVTREHYDILICDEAHKLRRNYNLNTYAGNYKKNCKRLGLDTSSDELDWILKQSDYQILFYDPKQRVSPTSIDTEYTKDRLNYTFGRFRPIVLEEQMRIKAGKGYVDYIYHILRQACSSFESFSNYEFRLFDSFREMRDRLFEKEEKYGLCRLCTGYGWEWKSKKDKNAADIVLEGIEIQWNSCIVGWLYDETLKEEMGSVYSLHGLDLNFAGVVIGRELYYDEKEKKIKLNKDLYFDNTVKRGTSNEDILEYLKNVYAVLMTRGIEGTYVYVCDEGLRRYLKQFIPS